MLAKSDRKFMAVLTIISEARSTRSSSTAAKRVVRALRALGLDDAAVIAIMSRLDYCRNDGTPYSASIERCW